MAVLAIRFLRELTQLTQPSRTLMNYALAVMFPAPLAAGRTSTTGIVEGVCRVRGRGLGVEGSPHISMMDKEVHFIASSVA